MSFARFPKSSVFLCVGIVISALGCRKGGQEEPGEGGCDDGSLCDVSEHVGPFSSRHGGRREKVDGPPPARGLLTL